MGDGPGHGGDDARRDEDRRSQAENTGDHRRQGAEPGNEAADDEALGAVAVEELGAAIDEVGPEAERPALPYLRSEVATEVIGEAVADDGAGRCPEEEGQDRAAARADAPARRMTRAAPGTTAPTTTMASARVAKKMMRPISDGWSVAKAMICSVKLMICRSVKPLHMNQV